MAGAEKKTAIAEKRATDADQRAHEAEQRVFAAEALAGETKLESDALNAKVEELVREVKSKKDMEVQSKKDSEVVVELRRDLVTLS